MSKKIYLISGFLLMALSLSSVIPTHAQTCKIKTCNGGNSGNSVYTEVYEYDYVEQKPEFPGGRSAMINFINSTRQYPQEAYQMGIEGRVTCSFVVQSDGKISHIQVLKGVESSLNNEAVRVVTNMPNWSPGKINEQPVPTRVVCCIPFRK